MAEQPQKDRFAEWLSTLGVTDEEVGRLRGVLPVVRRLRTERQPTLSSQRKALTDLSKALHDLIEASSRVVNVSDPDGLGLALLERLSQAGMEPGEALRTFDDLLDQLLELQLVVVPARERAKAANGQARERVRTLPIRLVHEAVPRLTPSTDEASPFRAIVEAVYEMAGHGQASVEWAIRAYIRERSESRLGPS